MNAVAIRISMALVAALALPGAAGCGSSPPPRTGFLTEYSALEQISESELRFESPDLGAYARFLVDPVEDRLTDDTDLTAEQRADAAAYFRDTLVEMLERNGFEVTEAAAGGTARFRIAITDIQKSTWWLNLHPGSKLTGAGTGRASMEGEILDAITGKQLAAFVRSGRGN